MKIRIDRREVDADDAIILIRDKRDARIMITPGTSGAVVAELLHSLNTSLIATYGREVAEEIHKAVKAKEVIDVRNQNPS